MDIWPGDWAAGTPVEITHTPYAGELGLVVNWKAEWGIPRRGLVPVWMPSYRYTFFWWMPPFGLKALDRFHPSFDYLKSHA